MMTQKMTQGRARVGVLTAGLMLGLMLGLAACDSAPPAEPAATTASPAQAPAALPEPVADAAPSPAAAPARAPDAPAPRAAPEVGDRPAFASLYPGAEVQGDPITAVGAAGPGGLVTFTTEAAPDAVIAFYRQRAEAAGLTGTMAMTQGDARAYGAAKGAEDGPSVQVVAAPDEATGATSVQLAWTRGR